MLFRSVSPSPLQIVDQSDCRIDIRRVGSRHALDGDGVIRADGDGADLDASSRVSLDFHGFAIELSFGNWHLTFVTSLAHRQIFAVPKNEVRKLSGRKIIVFKSEVRLVSRLFHLADTASVRLRTHLPNGIGASS